MEYFYHVSFTGCLPCLTLCYIPLYTIPHLLTNCLLGSGYYPPPQFMDKKTKAQRNVGTSMKRSR